MDYTQLTDSDVASMLATIGVQSIDDLFVGVDAQQKLSGLLDIPTGLCEAELLANLATLAGANRSTEQSISFLGAGIYDHFIPTLVDSLAMQSEFLTAYTPYQAEASQGILQAFYEFQTMVCQLLGMDVSNASLYEFSTATAEALFMAKAVTQRSKVLLSEAAHPDLIAVLKAYTNNCTDLELVTLPQEAGRTPTETVTSALDAQTAAVVIQHPNFFGALEDMSSIQQAARRAGALLVAVVDPISCGMLKRPGDYGADIAIAEGQALGIPQSYGGPILGLLACKQKYLRKMPGRVVGQTRDRDGRRSFCLTLQAREQHIRREKATSNVCTNQGLLAMRATVYLATMGKQGITQIARQSFNKAHYAATRINELPGYTLAFEQPFFKEFVVRCRQNVSAVLKHAHQRGILAGVPLGEWSDQLSDCFLVAVTERRTKQEIDQLVGVLNEACPA